MPRFFVPGPIDAATAEHTWQSVRAFMERTGTRTTERRIYSIEHVDDGRLVKDTVGDRHRYNNEEIVAILEGHEVFLCCTPTRGVVRGDPIMVGDRRRSVVVVEFDPA